MSGLIELGPLTEEIKVRGKTLTVGGLTVDDLIFLVQAFPQILDVMVEVRDDRLSSVKKLGPRIIAHIISCATGDRNDEAALRVAAKLPAGKQLEIFEKAFELTFEEGVDPFLDRLMRMATHTAKTVVGSESPSDDSLSASLVGDEPRKTRVPLRRAS